ncbi:hypothetical protein G6F31_016863 [Rhizopus arrhizus]|nr:hypothetical protein G6F31_016863 [Rhizopus arrhizus]
MSRCAVRRAQPVCPPRHQHEPHRVAPVAPRQVGIRLLHRPGRPYRRRADAGRAGRTGSALGADQGAGFLSGGRALSAAVAAAAAAP